MWYTLRVHLHLGIIRQHETKLQHACHSILNSKLSDRVTPLMRLQAMYFNVFSNQIDGDVFMLESR